MSESKFKNLRHIETVRNYLDAIITELQRRGQEHDQSKLQPPEVDIFEEYTPKLRNCTYGSEEYQQIMAKMQEGLKHHYRYNRHHPEHHTIMGIEGMNLIDLMEMLCDWKAATLRHEDGDIYDSLKINSERFNYSTELYQILKNTADLLESLNVYHHAEES